MFAGRDLAPYLVRLGFAPFRSSGMNHLNAPEFLVHPASENSSLSLLLRARLEILVDQAAHPFAVRLMNQIASDNRTRTSNWSGALDEVVLKHEHLAIRIQN